MGERSAKGVRLVEGGRHLVVLEGALEVLLGFQGWRRKKE